MVRKKRKELLFEVQEEIKVFPELDRVSELIQVAIDNYSMLKQLRKHEDAI
jgi:hypothetical protein